MEFKFKIDLRPIPNLAILRYKTVLTIATKHCDRWQRLRLTVQVSSRHFCRLLSFRFFHRIRQHGFRYSLVLASS